MDGRLSLVSGQRGDNANVNANGGRGLFMDRWVIGERCFSLRFGEGVVAAYEEGWKYPVKTMHVFKSRTGTHIFETEWTEEGKQYEFDCYPTLFSSREEVKNYDW
jgi:hypothetical protein